MERNCKNCTNGKFIPTSTEWSTSGHWRCAVKHKVVDWKKTRMFCKIFKPKGEADDNL